MVFHTLVKINIGLHILNKRDDGFHDIESIFYPIPFGDVIEIMINQDKDDIEFESFGIDIPGDSKNNLIVKAYQLLKVKYQLPGIKCAMIKRVPTGSGIGGGSADGAMMLKALNDFFNLNMGSSELETLSLELGSDCPFFIDCRPKLVSGRGEIMKDISIDLTGKFIVLACPPIHLSTKESYENLELKPRNNESIISKITQEELKYWSSVIENDFEEYAFSKHPLLSDIKSEFIKLGASYASMSGTGSTVYGIFEEEMQMTDLIEKHVIWSGNI